MTYIKSTSGLILPHRPPRPLEKEITVDGVKEWRSHLVSSKLTASIESFYELLLDLQQATLSEEQRFEILYILGPTLNHLTVALQKLSARLEINSENNILISELITHLHNEMVNNYKLILEGAIKARFPNTTLLLGALQKAFHNYNKIIFYHYEQHRTPPAGIWFNFNALYYFAKKHRLADRSLTKKMGLFTPFDTLETLYKCSLLLAIANPFRIRADEILNFKAVLEKWAPLLALCEPHNKVNPLFIIDLTMDDGPKYAVLNPQHSAHSYFLMLNKLNQHLNKLLLELKKEELSQTEKDFSPAELALSPQFIESLLTYWQALTEKFPDRQKMYGHINVCLGINASLWFMDREATLAGNTPLSPQTTVETLDMDILLSNNLPHSSHQETETSQYQCYSCELIDESEGGVCLKWAKNVPAQLQCGEIVTLEMIGPGQSQWSVGTIRWIKHEESHTTLVGIQLLSNQALAVKARFAEALTAQFTVPTLLLPEQPEAHRPITLIAPALPFKTGNEIEIEHKGESHKAILKKNYSLSPCYQQLEVEFLNGCFEFPPVTPNEKDLPQPPKV